MDCPTVNILIPRWFASRPQRRAQLGIWILMARHRHVSVCAASKDWFLVRSRWPRGITSLTKGACPDLLHMLEQSRCTRHAKLDCWTDLKGWRTLYLILKKRSFAMKHVPMCHSCCAARSSNAALLQYCIPHSLAWCAAAVLAALQAQHCCNAVAALFGTYGGVCFRQN